MDLRDTAKDAQLRTMNMVHRTLLTLSGGRIGTTLGRMPVYKVTTTGRVSGRPRTVMLTVPVRHGDAYVFVASKGGDDRHPDWYRNLVATPEFTIEAADGGEPESLIARTASVVAAWHNLREGREPPDPGDSGSHSAGFLRGLWGREPSAAEVRLMDTLLVIHAEHTFNASTFATREVASTKAHMYAAVSAGVGALSGALHGGANARVMDMLLEIETVDAVSEWVTKRV